MKKNILKITDQSLGNIIQVLENDSKLKAD
jgi:hypothetical protein